MDRDLQDLLAKQAITEQIYTYCRALDRMDRPAALAVWHDDGLADYGSIFKGTGAGFVDWVFEGHKRLASHSHQITNILIEVGDGVAASESYVIASLRSDDGAAASETIVRGRYADRWSYRNGRWAIEERTYVHDFDAVLSDVQSSIVGWGKRDESDPSHAVMAAVARRDGG